MKSGQRRRELDRAKEREANGLRVLPSGTVVHLHGIPITLRYSTEVQTAPGNWSVIDAEHAAIQAVEAPTWALTRATFGVTSVIMGGLSIFWWVDVQMRPLLVWGIPLTLGTLYASIFAHRWAVADNRGEISK